MSPKIKSNPTRKFTYDPKYKLSAAPTFVKASLFMFVWSSSGPMIPLMSYRSFDALYVTRLDQNFDVPIAKWQPTFFIHFKSSVAKKCCRNAWLTSAVMCCWYSTMSGYSASVTSRPVNADSHGNLLLIFASFSFRRRSMCEYSDRESRKECARLLRFSRSANEKKWDFSLTAAHRSQFFWHYHMPQSASWIDSWAIHDSSVAQATKLPVASIFPYPKIHDRDMLQA